MPCPNRTSPIILMRLPRLDDQPCSLPPPSFLKADSMSAEVANLEPSGAPKLALGGFVRPKEGTNVIVHNFAPQSMSAPSASGNRHNRLSQAASKVVAKGRDLVESSATNRSISFEWKSVPVVNDPRFWTSRCECVLT